MTDSDNLNSSLNTLLASFTHIDPKSIGSYSENSPIESICIDTSNTRIGINTLDPSYSLHIMDGNNGSDYSGNLYVSEFTCISGNINKLNIDNLDVSQIDVSSIFFNDTISGPNVDVSSIIFKDTITGPTVDVSSIININTISGINLLFDVSKIDINGTIDLSNAQFKPKFYIPWGRESVDIYQLYSVGQVGFDGMLMIKLPSLS